MTVTALQACQIDVAGVPTALIDTGAPAGVRAGQQAPPVLLLHGSGPGVTATANWRPVIPALSQDRRVIAPDQLGFGGTATGERRTYGRAAWTEHALALLGTLGTGPVDIIGNSMGGAIALSLAAARPAAVRRIVLMGSMGVAMALPTGELAAEEAARAGRPRPPGRHAMQVWCGFAGTREAARASLAPAMEGFYGLPFERFERYCPYGTADDVAAFLARQALAGFYRLGVAGQPG
ncbi:MAG: alpha/beta fold hydrolase [Streptosporangiaceae bacterium]